jgi:rubrerythrin
MLEAIASEVRKAIEKEKRAYRLYVELSQKSPNYNVQALMVQLATEELRHEALLKEALRIGSFSRAMLKMQVRQDELRVKDNLMPTVSMEGFRESIKFAIKRENAARIMYEDFASKETDHSLKELFEFLRSEEERHGALLMRELDRL